MRDVKYCRDCNRKLTKDEVGLTRKLVERDSEAMRYVMIGTMAAAWTANIAFGVLSGASRDIAMIILFAINLSAIIAMTVYLLLENYE